MFTGMCGTLSSFCLFRLLGVPLLPPRWQVRLGATRPERPPAQIARLEQALPDVFPEVAPGGVPPPAQQQGRDDQELQDQGPDAQEPAGQPGGQRDDVAPVSILHSLLHQREEVATQLLLCICMNAAATAQ